MINFDTPLIRGTFIKRYKRFFVDATLEDGTTVTAHCANTGSMKGLIAEGNGVWLSPVDDPKRKLKYTLQMIDVGTSLVGVNTSLPNRLVAEAIAEGTVPELTGYAHLKREVKYGIEGKSRIDILLKDDDKSDCYIEIKNTTLREGDAALFPDAVTTRGAKHLDELVAEIEQGNRAVMFYLIQREDCAHFAPAHEIDPTYAQKLKDAYAKGLEILAYSCTLAPTGIKLAKKLPVKI